MDRWIVQCQNCKRKFEVSGNSEQEAIKAAENTHEYFSQRSEVFYCCRADMHSAQKLPLRITVNPSLRLIQ